MRVTKSVTFRPENPQDAATIRWLKDTHRYNGGEFTPFVRKLLYEARLREEEEVEGTSSPLDLGAIRQVIRDEIGGQNGGTTGLPFEVSPESIHRAVAQVLDERHLSLTFIRQTVEAIIGDAGVHAGGQVERESESSPGNDDSWVDTMLETDMFL